MPNSSNPVFGNEPAKNVYGQQLPGINDAVIASHLAARTFYQEGITVRYDRERNHLLIVCVWDGMLCSDMICVPLPDLFRALYISTGSITQIGSELIISSNGDSKEGISVRYDSENDNLLIDSIFDSSGQIKSEFQYLIVPFAELEALRAAHTSMLKEQSDD